MKFTVCLYIHAEYIFRQLPVPAVISLIYFDFVTFGYIHIYFF